MFINKPSFWGSVVLATLSFGSCSRLSHSPSELFFHKTGRTAYKVDAPRKVYRYSVVPGGVYTGDELQRARRVDPVVTAHYSDFGDAVTVNKLASDMYVYVSYRKANRVYWSAKKHKIGKGEAVLTDGKHLARTRCGNRLSLTPQTPVAKLEPNELNGLVDDPLMASLPPPPLFLPPSGSGTPALVPGGYTGAAPAPVPNSVPSVSGAETPIGGSGAIVPPPSTAFVPPVLPLAPTTPTGPGGPTTPPTGPTTPPDTPGNPTTPVTPVVPVTPIPEPSESALLLIAALAAPWLWRKRQIALSRRSS